MNFFRKLFNEKSSKIESVDFDSIAEEKRKEFQWVGKPENPHFLYPYCENGLSLLVVKYGRNVNGVGWFVIEDFIEESGHFKIANNIPGYHSGAGIETGKEETDAIYARIKKLKKVTTTTVTEGWI